MKDQYRAHVTSIADPTGHSAFVQWEYLVEDEAGNYAVVDDQYEGEVNYPAWMDSWRDVNLLNITLVAESAPALQAEVTAYLETVQYLYAMKKAEYNRVESIFNLNG